MSSSWRWCPAFLLAGAAVALGFVLDRPVLGLSAAALLLLAALLPALPRVLTAVRPPRRSPEPWWI